MKFEHKRIKDICKFIGGSQPPKSEFVYEPREGYVRLIQTRDRLNDDYLTFIPQESTTKFCDESDILIGRYGPPIFQIFRGFKGAYNVALMKADPINGVDKDYLYYFLLQDSILKYVDSMSARTGGQTGVELDSLYEYPVLLPDIVGQKKISRTLKCIDNKILNNNKIIRELDACSHTLYNYWFLQFDYPNAEGKPYRSSGGATEWNEQLKRRIPKGWTAGTVSTLMKIENASVDPKKLENAVMEHYSIPAFDDDHSPAYEEANTIESSKYVVDPECILTSKLNPRFKRLWDPYCDTENAICSTEFIVYRPITSWMRPFCYAVLNSDAFYVHMSSKATASTGSRKRIQPDVSASFELPIPDEDTMRSFVELYGPIMEKQKALYKENRELKKLRDWLLPMLMSGQATVVDVEDESAKVIPFASKSDTDQRFATWLQNQGIAARGDIDMQTMREIFDAMDDDDK